MDMQSWLNGAVGGRYGNIIDGVAEEANGNASAIHNPARRDQCLGHFAESSNDDVDRAVTAAHRAWKTWREVPGPERGALLFRAADLLEQRVEELAFILSAEQGKVLAESRGEVMRAAKELRFSAGEASRIDGTTLPSEKRNGFAMTMRAPVGVVAAIAPWNFPIVTPVRKIGPALAYGCTVVLKPANLTPWSAVRLMDVFRDAGIPKSVVNLVLGSGRGAGEALVRHPLVRGVSFTGSTRTGADINAQLARRFVRAQLELGGKNPAVVLSYRDVGPVAKQIASAAFACTGQRCTAISRVVVLDSLADEVTEALTAELAAIRVGPAWDPAATMGPLITEQHRVSVLRNLAAGLDEGARLRFGGGVLDQGALASGHFMEPTLLDRVQPNTKLAREEVFGPVLSVIAVPDADRAFEVANAVEYGLAASIFTRDVDQAFRFMRDSQSGMVHVNHGTASEAHLPFGGVKGSGYGAYSIGHSNQDFFTELKAAYVQA
ncbi:aldehyde dehydrogenase (NAD+) [Azospirillum agricola]|uniref:aldehyde dehydrogenase family protein n=1 Tax=Azospirillum agricola TaxID=1720247 RepID=UPI001AEB2117|nr:aldehyde dehydrogenase family protein [Azospirillum agricola]MBP2230964.1 aldehyde dehydrogenase (NAD+) [Azospirillum agricola]